MVTNPYFAIGDLQGCLESLDGLLEQLPEDAPLIFLGLSLIHISEPTRP